MTRKASEIARTGARDMLRQLIQAAQKDEFGQAEDADHACFPTGLRRGSRATWSGRTGSRRHRRLRVGRWRLLYLQARQGIGPEGQVGSPGQGVVRPYLRQARVR